MREFEPMRVRSRAYATILHLLYSRHWLDYCTAQQSPLSDLIGPPVPAACTAEQRNSRSELPESLRALRAESDGTCHARLLKRLPRVGLASINPMQGTRSDLRSTMCSTCARLSAPPVQTPWQGQQIYTAALSHAWRHSQDKCTPPAPSQQQQKSYSRLFHHAAFLRTDSKKATAARPPTGLKPQHGIHIVVVTSTTTCYVGGTSSW
jgi:hypothetical protein